MRCSKCAQEWHADALSVVDHAAPQPNAREEALRAIAAARAASPSIPTESMPTESIIEVVPVEEVHSAEARIDSDDFLKQLEAAIGVSEANMEAPRQRPAGKEKGFVRPIVAAPKKPINVKPFKLAVPVLAALWLILAFITYFPSWMNTPVLGGIYSMFGIAPTEGLVFADVTMEREHEEGGKTKFILAGSIKNNSNATRAVPTVRVNLRDAQGKNIWGRSYLDPKAVDLNAGEVYPFKINNVETVFASNVKVITVDMGNTLQLMMR